MKANQNVFVVFIGLIFFLVQTGICQQKYTKSPGNKLIKKLIIAVERNPRDIKVHDQFINGFDINDERLIKQYSVWMRKYPKNAVVPFAIGKAFAEHNFVKCEDYLKKAIMLKPDFADAWGYLSQASTMRGDTAKAILYMGKAAAFDPGNSEFYFQYAHLNSNGDPAKYDSLLLNVVHKFPENERSAEALYYLAALPYNTNEKAAYFETLSQMHKLEKTQWYREGMAKYFEYLLEASPEKAFELTIKMATVITVNYGDWKRRMTVVRYFLEARDFMKAGEPIEAERLLEKINLGNSKNGGITIDLEEQLTLFKAEAADAANNTKEAFDTVALSYSKKPSDNCRHALLKYGAKLALDSNKVDSIIWKIREYNAWKQTDFSLENFIDHKVVSLSSYRGKVVLLTFWAPSCFPCRREFAHFEAVLKKINSNNVAYLAINAFNQEEDFILPYLKSTGYSFVPLRDDPNKAKGNLPPVFSIPDTYIIDATGRVVFSDFLIDDANEKSLELMIRELLKSENLNNSY